MKIANVEQITSQWSEIRKLESAASVTDFLVDALHKGDADWQSKVQIEKNLVQTLTQAKADIEQAKQTAEQAKTQAEERAKGLETQIRELKNAQASAEADQKFKERMTALDEAFNLDDEDRELLAPEVRACADDTSFAAFKKKQDKLMCGKKKAAASAAPAAVIAAPAAAVVVAATVREAMASVVPIAGEGAIPAGAPAPAKSLRDEYAEAFGNTIKIDGKTAAERSAAKASSKTE